MDEQRAQRTLVKSPPELWAEISDLQALSRHLGEFGDIRITRSEPETAVAWEGDRARGTVDLEPAGWGTRVTLTAVPVERPPAAAAEPEDEPERRPAEADSDAAADPGAEPEAAPDRDVALTRRGLWARLVARFRRQPDEEPAPESEGHPREGEEHPASTQDGPPDAEDPVPAVPDASAPASAPAPCAAADPARTAAILVEVLDDLGAARHRPFSRIG